MWLVTNPAKPRTPWFLVPEVAHDASKPGMFLEFPFVISGMNSSAHSLKGHAALDPSQAITRDRVNIMPAFICLSQRMRYGRYYVNKLLTGIDVSLEMGPVKRFVLGIQEVV